MRPTRRDVCTLAAAAVAGCVSDPGASCRGATVWVSMRPISSAESPLLLDPASLSAEAVVVAETAIEDEHVERCVSWEPGRNETGPSTGLAELGDRIESHAGVDLTTDEHVELDVRFRGETYLLSLDVESGETT